MTRCPWSGCGMDLEEGHRHVGHEAWAADAENEYVRHVAPDGTVDVYRVPKARAEAFRERLRRGDEDVERRRSDVGP